jgi:hypothetical protein
MISISCIVEGRGEVAAVPLLLRRIAWESSQTSLEIPRPVLAPRNRLLKGSELDRYVELAVRKASGQRALLILLDADDDCPKQLGPDLLKRAITVRADVPIAVVLAKREFEAWFLASSESLVRKGKLPLNFVAPPKPEEVRGAKERLGQSYSETRDQPGLTATFDFESARKNSPSFDKCYREVVRLITELTKKESP